MSVEAEQAIVAACIETAAAYDSASELTPLDFTDPHMALLFELVAKMRSAGRPVDAITMAGHLAKSARWATLYGGDPVAYVQSLIGCARSFRNIAGYVDIVRSAATARAMLAFCSEVVELAYDKTLNGEQKLAEMHARLPSLEAGASSGFVTYSDAAKEAMRSIMARADGEVSGISSGMANVDRMTGGFEPGTLVILAGRPSHGKSLYGMQWSQAAAESAGPVLVFSLEMSASNLAMRGLSAIGTIDFGELRQAHVDEQMVSAMRMAHERMRQMPVYIDDRGGISVDQLRARARIMARREKPAMIVTDYLTLLSGVGENRTAQVGYVSRSMKAMAKELDCPVLCLAQLNRGVDSRPEKRPTLSDLRDSGEIEQDADIVVFTYLHEKYVPNTQRKGYGELIFAKQRNGETGSVFTEWEGRYQRFRSFDGEVPPEAPLDTDDGNNVVPMKHALGGAPRRDYEIPR